MQTGPSATDDFEDRFLLTLAMRLAGTQYYEAQYRPGESVFFRREPSNTYDARAIGIQNESFQKIGYIPREEAFWLAPLLDAGQLRITGRIALPQSPPNPDSELELSLYLSPKGEILLSAFPQAHSEYEALHNAFLEILKQADQSASPRIAKALAERLKGLLSRSSLPQTQLVLRLIEQAGKAAAEQRAATSATLTVDWLRGLYVGEPASQDGLALFPLFGTPPDATGYLLLEEALELSAVEIREVSDGGSVPELLVINLGDLAVLLPEGQVVAGGKQNRVINLSVIVEAHSEYLLPVSCVEQGRWSSAKETFRAASFAPTKLRARKMASANLNLRARGVAESDQGQVWEDVHECLLAADIASPTGDLTASFEGRATTIGAMAEKLPLAEEAVGFVFALGSQLLGGEVFDSPKTLRALWPGLREAYFVRAEFDEAVEGSASSEEVKAFLALLSDGVLAPEAGDDDFDRPELALAGFVGSALVWRGAVRHLAILELATGDGFPFER